MNTPPPHIAGGFYLSPRAISEELEEKPAHYLKLWDWMLRRAFFRDGKDLNRGEFLTTIDEMRNVGGYSSGSARKPLTKDQVRSAYGHLTGTGRITTRKTTRGMVITVCNYDELQNPRSYASHTMPRTADLTETTRTPHYREMNEKEGKEKKKPLPSEALRLAEMLAELILQNNAGNTQLTAGKKATTVARWGSSIEKLQRIDGTPWEEIEAVIHWCQRDEFWCSNILSGETLRKQWNRLITKMKSSTATATRSIRTNPTTDDPVTDWFCDPARRAS